jgi:hypothetical protein
MTRPYDSTPCSCRIRFVAEDRGDCGSTGDLLLLPLLLRDIFLDRSSSKPPHPNPSPTQAGREASRTLLSCVM